MVMITPRDRYYLEDGFYPRWATFVRQSQGVLKGKELGLLSARRLAGRTSSGHLVCSKLDLLLSTWSKDQMAYVMAACMILYNMIIESEREI